MNYKGKIRNTKKKKRIILLLAVVIVASTVVKFITDYNVLSDAYESKKSELGDLETQTLRTVYITNRDIKAGEVISSQDVTYEGCYSSMDNSLFATVIEEGMQALVDMPTGTQVLNSMVSSESVDANIRDEEFNVIHLSSNLLEADTVDVRILYPNGENYIVLSKKILKSLNVANMNCFMWLAEQETLLMSSAIVDAYLTPGTTLYTTKYVASSIQEASETNYIPSKQIIKLIKENPNIIETAKKELSVRVRSIRENRINEFIEKNYGVDSEDSATKEDSNEFESYLYGDGTASTVLEDGSEKTTGVDETEIDSDKTKEEEIKYVD